MDRKPHQERSLVILKPDSVQRALMGDIINRFERTGLKFSAMKMFVPTEDQLTRHYNKDDTWFIEKGERILNERKEAGLVVDKEAIEYGKDIIRAMVHYMTVAPVVAFILEGNQAVVKTRKLVGTTEPATADIGTIRGDYTVDSYGHASFEDRAVRNLIHCSESPEEAEREIAIWFTDSEVMQYGTAHERIMYDVNFDGERE